MFHPYSEALRGQFVPLLPEMVLALAACVLYIGGTFRADRRLWSNVAIAALVLALIVLALTRIVPPTGEARAAWEGQAFGVPFWFDDLANLTRLLAMVGGIVLVLTSWSELPERQTADHHACLLLIVAGTGLIGAANDLVALFAALEVVSIPTYILLYLPRHDEAAQEAALKYFLLSIFSSALMLFGLSYLYGLAGTTNIAGILQTFAEVPAVERQAAAGLAQVALIMVVAGFGFRITAVPFHFYAPDVYQGTATSTAALLAFLPKVGGFAALVRLFGFVVPAAVQTLGIKPGMAVSDQVPVLLWFLAVVTMSLGNVLALLQDNLKRLLAYSSVAHAGYMLVALASAPYLAGEGGASSGVTALMFYLVAYGAMTIGAFAVIGMLDTPERPVESVDDLAGLSRSHPLTALMLTLLLLSLIGIPFTAGFLGKFLVFFGAISVREAPTTLYIVLALIGFVNAAVGAWYYLRIIAVMYLRTAVRPIETHGQPPAVVALALCVALTLGLSVPPGADWLIGAARRAAHPAPIAPADAAQAAVQP